MSKYFKEIEYNMDADFLAKLDEARELANIPFTINSAYRSPEQNARVGGKPNSSHLRGLAVDIRVNDSSTRYIVLNALISVGFNRIGVEGSFIHVDDDKSKSDKVVWTY
jgi:zinc D-Ala-D-Ala carboxypeptidase